MNPNLNNALHGVQEARTGIFVMTGTANTDEQEAALEAMQTKLNEVEEMIKGYK